VKKTLLALVIIILVVASGVGGWILRPHTEFSLSLKEKDAPIITESVPSDRDMERELIRYDIKESGTQLGLSARQQDEYLEYLEVAANRYNLPMILVHTVAYVESGYDPSAIHPQITVKGKSTRAVGLMGIVWEYNSVTLIRDSIATTRLELTEPKINLMAGASILHTDIEEVLAKTPKVKEDRFFDELIKKYYGAYDETYKNRMLTKMKDIASKQWIRRTVKNIIVSRQSPIIQSVDTTK